MKVKALIYCTKAKPYLWKYYCESDNYNGITFDTSLSKEEHTSVYEGGTILNGTIVAECEVETEKIDWVRHIDGDYYCETESIGAYDLQTKSCLSQDDLNDYLDYENGYALHISNLNVFDKPLEIPSNEILGYSYKNDMYHYLKKAPMNMCWVFHNGEWKVLISIRPQWVCKELNGEKPIEVRRKVLKGMCD